MPAGDTITRDQLKAFYADGHKTEYSVYRGKKQKKKREIKNPKPRADLDGDFVREE